MTKFSMLEKISSPDDIKEMSIKILEQVAVESRAAILEKVSTLGGHLGPNLGTVELTLALHYVFHSPVDKFVWDVSHQSYTHKILTGRQEGFTNPELYHKYTGYTAPHESEHDHFTIGHTSTSISLATGIARARDIKGENYNVVAIIGDGSLSGGEAYEGLNNAATLNSNFIVIVNDNEMSISENVGGLYQNLADLRSSKGTAENNFFKALGFDYIYLEDGHNLDMMIQNFSKIKDSNRPVVVHIHTEKGHGYEVALADKEKNHWTMPFDLKQGRKEAMSEESYATILTNELMVKAEADPSIIAIHPGVGHILFDFREKYPNQYLDVGIAEEHAVAMASGMASQKVKPVVFLSSTFVQRAYDQIMQDLCIDSNPAVLVISGGTIDGNDVTHLGTFDAPMLSNIPNLVYLAPATKEELVEMFDWAVEQKSNPVAIKMPSGSVISNGGNVVAFKLNKSVVTQQGEKIAILGAGAFYQLAEAVGELVQSQVGIMPTLVNPRFISGVDNQVLTELLKNHELVITLEDGQVEGGFGPKVTRFYGNTAMKVLNFGADKEFTDRTTKKELYEKYELMPNLIIKKIIEILK